MYACPAVTVHYARALEPQCRITRDPLPSWAGDGRQALALAAGVPGGGGGAWNRMTNVSPTWPALMAYIGATVQGNRIDK
jgi:hypothetical protein